MQMDDHVRHREGMVSTWQERGSGRASPASTLTLDLQPLGPGGDERLLQKPPGCGSVTAAAAH